MLQKENFALYTCMIPASNPSCTAFEINVGLLVVHLPPLLSEFLDKVFPEHVDFLLYREEETQPDWKSRNEATNGARFILSY